MSGKHDLLYERYRLGELSDAERTKLESEKDFKERIARLEASDAEIREKYPAEEMAAAIRERARRNENAAVVAFPRRIALPLAAAAAVAIAVFIAIPGFGPQDDGFRTKGVAGDIDAAPSLVVFRQVSGETETLTDGSPAAENDLIQLAYTSGEGYYGAIFSVDGRGVFTLHWPDEGNVAVPLTSGRDVSLPFAYQLDDAPDFETFHLVWSDSPYDLERLEDAATRSTGEEDPFDLAEIVGPAEAYGRVSVKLRK